MLDASDGDDVCDARRRLVALLRGWLELREATEGTPGDEEPDEPDRRTWMRTDAGNAERLAYHRGRDLLWLDDEQAWLAWSGRRWQRASSTRVVDVGIQVARLIYAEAHEDADDADAIRKWAFESESVSRLRAMEFLARAKLALPEGQELDAHPWLLNVENGTIDVRGYPLRPHDRRQRITQLAPVRYLEDATCPAWEQFIHWMCCGDNELMMYLQTWAGYCLSGDVGQQVICVLHGSTGGNGKSTFATVLRTMLGKDYAAPAPPGFLMRRSHDEHPTSLWSMRGRRLMIASEVDDDARIDAPRLKFLTGEDDLTARGMRQDFAEFRLTTKLMLLTNPRPVFDGADSALVRRFHLVPCDATLTREQRDPTLVGRLLAEKEGILQWALRGAERLWEQGRLIPTTRMLSELDSYRTEMDSFGLWLEERCELAAPYSETSAALYASYTSFITERREGVLGKTRWGAKMRTHGGFEERRLGHQGSRGWGGVRLRIG